MREWQSLCRSAGVAGLMEECESGRAYIKVRELQGLCRNSRVAEVM